MNKEWLLLDAGDGWKIVLPDSDTKPHAKIVLIYPDGRKEATVADFDCPCRPEVDFQHHLVIHNAFDKRQ